MSAPAFSTLEYRRDDSKGYRAGRQAHAASANSTQHCYNEWDFSPAAWSCTTGLTIVWDPSQPQKCKITVSCPRDDGALGYYSDWVPLNSVGILMNCNGNLSISECEDGAPPDEG